MGLSRKMHSLDKSCENTSKLKGTSRYLAPEQLNNQVTLKCDIWQFGCVLLELCTGL